MSRPGQTEVSDFALESASCQESGKKVIHRVDESGAMHAYVVYLDTHHD